MIIHKKFEDIIRGFKRTLIEKQLNFDDFYIEWEPESFDELMDYLHCQTFRGINDNTLEYKYSGLNHVKGSPRSISLAERK